MKIMCATTARCVWTSRVTLLECTLNHIIAPTQVLVYTPVGYLIQMENCWISALQSTCLCRVSDVFSVQIIQHLRTVFTSIYSLAAPNITTLEYNISADLTVANITCLTEVSPPTHVTWMMDGSILNVYNHNENYSFLQVVTNRKRVHYRNTLVINNALIFIGTHTITCVVTNIAGNDSMSIVMHFPGRQRNNRKICKVEYI